MMRPIVIHCAMDVEIDFLKKKIVDLKKNIYGNFIIYEGMFNGYPVILNVSGVGIINAASDIMYVIDKYNPLCVINLGIVGSCSDKIHRNDLVVGNKCLNINSYKTSYLDRGKGSDYKSWNIITFKEGVDELVYWNCNNILLNIINNISGKYLYGNIINGVIGSGDVWNSEVDRLLFLSDKYGVVCSDMECVSVYIVCNNFNVPAISLKVVSDNIILGEDYDREVSNNMENILLVYINEVIMCKDFIN